MRPERPGLATSALLLLCGLVSSSSVEESWKCAKGCRCPQSSTLECVDLDIDRIPADWPTHFEQILLRNCSISTIQKNAFRKFSGLEELRIESCPKLDVLDKFAFKGLQKLKVLHITGNAHLRELHRYGFSSIANENPLKILLKNNGVEKVHAYAFKNAHNLRELHLEDRCYTIEENGLSSMSRVDFVTLRGACSIATGAFSNTSRIHQLNLVDSTLNLGPGMFQDLSHVNQIQIRENRLGKIDENAFEGLFTAGSLQLQANHIGRLSARGFLGMENVGVLLVSYNTVREPLDSPECLLHSAHKLVFSENTLHCSCEMQWIERHQDQVLLAENYCDRSEAFKALAYFKPAGCPAQLSHEPPAPPPATHFVGPDPAQTARAMAPDGFGRAFSAAFRVRPATLVLLAITQLRNFA